MPVLFAESLFDDCRQIQVATLPHTLQPIFSSEAYCDERRDAAFHQNARKVPHRLCTLAQELKGAQIEAWNSTVCCGFYGWRCWFYHRLKVHRIIAYLQAHCHMQMLPRQGELFKGCVIANALARDIRPVTGKAAQTESHSEGNLFIALLLPFPFFWKLP